MPIINITVKGKVASSDTKAIVNGNSDYAVNWVLDGEWADYDTKTMRVRFFDGSVINSIFSGTSCSLPVITETCMIEIGLFAGDLITSTPAVINCIRCIRDDEGPVQDPTPSIYDQLLAKLNELGGVSPDDVTQAVADYMKANPFALVATSGSYNDLTDKPTIPSVPTETIQANAAARHEHSNKTVLDGITGQVTPEKVNSPDHSTDLVQYGAFRLAALQIIAQIPTVPTALKNPHSLTIKIGNTTVTYDGSAAKTVEIADGTEVSY